MWNLAFHLALELKTTKDPSLLIQHKHLILCSNYAILSSVNDVMSSNLYNFILVLRTGILYLERFVC